MALAATGEARRAIYPGARARGQAITDNGVWPDSIAIDFRSMRERAAGERLPRIQPLAIQSTEGTERVYCGYAALAQTEEHTPVPTPWGHCLRWSCDNSFSTVVTPSF